MNQNTKPGLFDEFPPVPATQWEAKIFEDLKGADYEKILVWHTPEGIKINPYYRREDIEKIPYVKSVPGRYPFIRGQNTTHNHWFIREDIDETDPAKANNLALTAIRSGANALGLNVKEIDTSEKLCTLLNGIDPCMVQLHFSQSENYTTFFEEFAKYISLMEYKKIHIKGSINYDPIGCNLLFGKLQNSNWSDLSPVAELFKTAIINLPNFDLITVNGQYYHNSGAHAVQELSFILSHANEYLAGLTDSGLLVDDISPRMQFTIGVGSRYFLEIAKIRALKILWARIAEQYQPKTAAPLAINIHAVTSSINKSIYDPYTNILRTTTEAMSAAVAGVNSITILPYDSTYTTDNEFARRIARNQQIILKYESYMDKVTDPSAGSYYIEKITDSIAEATWKKFVEIEESGGFAKAVESGFIKSEIEETRRRHESDVAMRRNVYVGVNQFTNPDEKMADKVCQTIERDNMAIMRPYRATQSFESLRMNVEKHQLKGFHIPKVYLFVWGNSSMRSARAAFASGFFGCAGYSVFEGPPVATLKEGINKAFEANPDIVVLCSSDEEYIEILGAVKEIRKKAPKVKLVVAGNPAAIIEQLDKAGVQHYIHLRTNVLETLKKFNTILGIN